MKLFISIVFLTTNIFAATELNTTICSLVSEIETYTVSDNFGNSVLTKKIRRRKCVNDVVVKGKCLEYERQTVDYNVTAPDYNEAHTKDFSGTMGSLMGILGGVNNSLEVLSGWTGYCIEGEVIDFSWAEDPYMWANMAMSSFMALGGSDAVSGALFNKALDAGTTIQTAQKLAKLGTCMAASSVQITQNVEDYVNLDKKGPPCNPVDEFCDDSAEDIENSVMSIERKTYKDLIAQNPDNANFITVLSDPNTEQGLEVSDSDIIIVRIATSNNIDYTASAKEVEEARKKLQLIKAAAQSASIGATITSCYYGGSSAGTNTGTTNDSDSAVESAGKQAIAGVAGAFGGPFAGMATQLLLNTATSFTSVDTCKDEDDAEARGGRHVATRSILQSRHPDMCRKQYDNKCIEHNPINNKCIASGYTFCCYDSPIAGYLMAEIKAQIGRNWVSCSDFMLSELSDVSMRECTDNEKLDGENGASEKWTVEEGTRAVESGGYSSYHDMAMHTFYQAKHRCLNYDHLKQYYKTELKGIVDQKSLEKQIDQMFNNGE